MFRFVDMFWFIMCFGLFACFLCVCSRLLVCLLVYLFVYLAERPDATDAGGGAGQPGDRPGAHQEGSQRQPGRRGERTQRRSPLCVFIPSCVVARTPVGRLSAVSMVTLPSCVFPGLLVGSDLCSQRGSPGGGEGAAGEQRLHRAQRHGGRAMPHGKRSWSRCAVDVCLR